MPRINAIPRSDLESYEPMFSQLEEFFGFLPNDYLTMAHKPGLLEAVAQLTEVALFSEGTLPMDLRLLVCYIASRAAGCQYCTAHTGQVIEKFDVSMDKIVNIANFETHAEFTDKERAALRIANGANQIPNAVTDADFATARDHFTQKEIVDIVALTAMMSVYNKWNDTLATELETPPAQFAAKELADTTGWALGKHAG